MYRDLNGKIKVEIQGNVNCISVVKIEHKEGTI